MSKASSQTAKKNNSSEKSQEKSKNLSDQLLRIREIVNNMKTIDNIYEIDELVLQIEKVLDEDIGA